MSCTPLNIQSGLFITVTAWSKALSATFDGKPLPSPPGGANPGLSVQQGAKSLFHPLLSTRSLSYMVLGNKYLVILDMESGAGASTRWLSLVDFSTWTEVNILTVTASSNAIPPPIVNPSQGNASVFLAYGQDGTQHTSVAIHRSDNADVLCALAAPIVPTGQTAGEAAAAQLIIHYVTGGTSQTQGCPLPAGVGGVTPSSNSFPDLFVGGCPFTPSTKQFTIKNTGTDCLTINSIANSGPFTVKMATPAIGSALGPNETMSVIVEFNPTTTGNWNPANLVVSASDGNHNLACVGRALAASFAIQFNQTTFNFGKLPVGQKAPTQNLVITNNGSRPLTSVSVPSVSGSGFSSMGFSGTIDCTKNSGPIPIDFTPALDGAASFTFNVADPAPGNPHAITLNGEGCIANALIAVPPSAPIDLGQIQQGFRTVKFFEVQNTGDGPLTFDGTISGPDVVLFGLPDPAGSVTNPPSTRTYTAEAIAPCGNFPAGSGKVIVAISFFAGAAPSPTSKSATLTLSGHNATNFPPTQTWTFPLSVVITAPVAVDVALVVDHSGSMNDALGSRVKIDAAISASQLFVELLRPDLDDRVAVVRFDQSPDVVVPMTPVSTTAAPTQGQIRAKVATDIPPATGTTAIAAGAMTGIKEVQKPRATTPAALTQAVIVLTDGIENRAFEDPSGGGNWFSIRGGTLPKPEPQTGTVNTTAMPKPSPIKIYAVGVGLDSEIDSVQLAALASSAQNLFRVNQNLSGATYFQLEKYYTQIFMDLVGTASVTDPMYTIAPGQRHEIEFDVLPGDVEALVVLFDYEGMRLPFYCLSPSGEIIDAGLIPPGYQLRSGWTPQTRFLTFKMPALDPKRYAGRWKVVIEHRGQVCMGPPVENGDRRGFLPKECRTEKNPVLYGIAIGVGSNFRMAPFVTPPPVYVGDPILLSAMVTEAGLPVLGCTVTVHATSPSGGSWTLTLFDDGAHADAAANDGEYANWFTQTFDAGTYHFLFRAVGVSRDGQPVVREAARDKVALDRQPPGGGGDGGHGRDDECCKELIHRVDKQLRLLEEIAERKRKA